MNLITYYPNPNFQLAKCFAIQKSKKFDFFRFFSFNVAKLGQKLFLRIAIKFESINVLPLGEIFSEKILSNQDIV
jgi:hypothetical protein